MVNMKAFWINMTKNSKKSKNKSVFKKKCVYNK